MVQARSTCLLDKAVPWWAFVWPSCPAVSIRLIKLSCGEYSFDQAVRQRVFVWPSCPADGIRLTKLSGGGRSFDQAIRRWAFVWLSCPAVSIRLTKLSSCVYSFEQAIYQQVQFGSTVLSENILFLSTIISTYQGGQYKPSAQVKLKNSMICCSGGNQPSRSTLHCSDPFIIQEHTQYLLPNILTLIIVYVVNILYSLTW